MPRYSRSCRLHSAEQFQLALRRGKRARSRHVEMFWWSIPDDIARCAVIIGRRIGNAVARNRCKRLVREWLRTTRESLPSGCWIVRGLPTLAELSAQELWDQLTRLSQSVRRRP